MKISPSSKAGIIMNNVFTQSFEKLPKNCASGIRSKANSVKSVMYVQQEESSLKSIEFFWSIHIFHVTLSLEGYFFFIFLLLSNEHVVEYV